ncbi:MAG: hypothetical protein GYB66_12080, partial [Chloroflexi bacterium]|nr:hypothetical protein [Chloroflexota bacterium]
DVYKRQGEPAVDTHIEPPAASTAPSRPTDLRPPDRAHQPSVPDKPAREPGAYMGYACVWVVRGDILRFDDGALVDAMKRWLHRSAEANDWDLVQVDIGEVWVNLHIEIPQKVIPGEVVAQLMEDTHQALADAQGVPLDEPIWAHGYSVATPGRLMDLHEIERFVQFYQD